VQVKRALFAEAFDDLLDQCVVDAVPTELLSTVLGRSPANNGGPENPSRDSETKEKGRPGISSPVYGQAKDGGVGDVHRHDQGRHSPDLLLVGQGCGGDDPATVYIPQDPACALEVMRSLHCPTTGNRNTDSIGEGLLVEAGRTSRAEMTQSQVADMRERFQKESLAESMHKANVLVDTMYVACHGVPNRLPCAIVDECNATVDRLSEQPGMRTTRDLKPSIWPG
jgi:hypothetical protein